MLPSLSTLRILSTGTPSTPLLEMSVREFKMELYHAAVGLREALDRLEDLQNAFASAVVQFDALKKKTNKRVQLFRTWLDNHKHISDSAKKILKQKVQDIEDVHKEWLGKKEENQTKISALVVDQFGQELTKLKNELELLKQASDVVATNMPADKVDVYYAVMILSVGQRITKITTDVLAQKGPVSMFEHVVFDHENHLRLLYTELQDEIQTSIYT